MPSSNSSGTAPSTAPSVFDAAYPSPRSTLEDPSTAGVLRHLMNSYIGILPFFDKLTDAEKDAAADRLLEALTVGITPATLKPHLNAFVDCTSVHTKLACCATCGRRPLPDIQPPVQKGRAPKVKPGNLTMVPLENVGRLYPCTRLTRGKCAVCAARRGNVTCLCDFVQVDLGWGVQPARGGEPERPLEPF